MDSTRNAVIETERMFHALDGQFFGKYRGLVVDNTDPTYRGRLQVKVPAVMGEETLWAEPCAPYAGDGVGFFALPPANAGVWVEFEAGDPARPLWTGFWWGDGEMPAPSGANTRVLVTPASLKLVLVVLLLHVGGGLGQVGREVPAGGDHDTVESEPPCRDC